MSGTPRKINRIRFLETAGLGLAGVAVTARPQAALAAGGPMPAAKTPEEAIRLLQAGNQRFLNGKQVCETLTATRLELASGQRPFATFLGCSDSRVPVNTLFDQKPGQLFVVRVAGNFVDDAGLGSIEYAVAALNTPLVVVLGHSACGAVEAAIKYVANGNEQPGHIMGLVRAIAPAVNATKNKSGSWLYNSIVQNVRNNVAALTERSEIIADAVKTGTVMVVGGVYDLHSGKITPLQTLGEFKPLP